MSNEQEESLTPQELLHQEIETYLDTHLYGHWTIPFMFGGLIEYDLVKQTRPEANTYAILLVNVEEEDLSEIDNEWMSGLKEVGKKFEVELFLPTWYFQK